jgi:hypothetical protein
MATRATKMAGGEATETGGESEDAWWSGDGVRLLVMVSLAVGCVE